MKQSHKANNAQRDKDGSGFALPLVVVLGFILVIGGMTLIARSFGGLVGSVRQQKAREAREAAETGIAMTLESLNREYSYLLINCYPNEAKPVAMAGEAPIEDDYSDPSDYQKALDAYNNAKSADDQALEDYNQVLIFATKDIPVKNSCKGTGSWENPVFPSAICAGSSTGHPELSPGLSNNTRYRIEYYGFFGSEFYGGKGTIKVTGMSLNSDKTRVLASATVQQTFDVTTTPCGGIPGLLMMKGGDLGNNDVKGLYSGNVHCIACIPDGAPNNNGQYSRQQLEDAINAKSGSDIDGQISVGPLSMPPVPLFPFTKADFDQDACVDDEPLSCYSLEDLNAERAVEGKPAIEIQAIDIGANTIPSDGDHTNAGLTVIASAIPGALNVPKVQTENEFTYTTSASGVRLYDSIDGNEDGKITDFCVVLPNKTQVITHCLVNDIDLQGSKILTVNSANGPVRIYVTGSKVEASGKTGIFHTWESANHPSQQDPPPASRFGLFGKPKTSDDACEDPESNPLTAPFQQVKLAGTSTAASLFAYFPCGTTGINGGASAPVCTDDGECGGGDISGAVWTANWGYSDSNQAELTVPGNMADQLRYFFGEKFAISVRRYFAKGVSDWRGFQGLSQ